MILEVVGAEMVSVVEAQTVEVAETAGTEMALVRLWVLQRLWSS